MRHPTGMAQIALYLSIIAVICVRSRRQPIVFEEAVGNSSLHTELVNEFSSPHVPVCDISVSVENALSFPMLFLHFFEGEFCVLQDSRKPFRSSFVTRRQRFTNIHALIWSGVVRLFRQVQQGIYSDKSRPCFEYLDVGLSRISTVPIKNMKQRAVNDSCRPVVYVFNLVPINRHPATLRFHANMSLSLNRHDGLQDSLSLCLNCFERTDGYDDSPDSDTNQEKVWQVFRCKQTLEVALRVVFGMISLYGGALLIYYDGRGRRGRRWWARLFDGLGTLLVGCGLGAFLLPVYWQDGCNEDKGEGVSHRVIYVTQKLLTTLDYCNTLIA